jgi:L-lactate dehydrogenase (cytochrome)/(S)-mandelate dehydrogenase
MWTRTQFDLTLNWKDIAGIKKRFGGPVVVKGVLDPEDARLALQNGADAIIVSNHGGRQLDGAAATLDALPGIVEAVAGRIPILIDGGIRRGGDVVKALAAGASACLIGRPQLWGLAIAGEAGVAHMLSIYRQEIDRVMGLCGVASVAGITKDLLLQPRNGRNA